MKNFIKLMVRDEYSVNKSELQDDLVENFKNLMEYENNLRLFLYENDDNNKASLESLETILEEMRNLKKYVDELEEQ